MLPQLTTLDGDPVTPEEAARAQSQVRDAVNVSLATE